MKKTYNQPEIEVTSVASMMLMADGSATIGTDPQIPGGVGGNAPARNGDLIPN